MEASMTSTPEDAQSEHEDYHEREATEMNQYGVVDRNDDFGVPLAEGARATATGTQRYLHNFPKLVKTSWKRQVRATVAHEACRDHFGTYSFSSGTARFNTLMFGSSAMSPLTIWEVARVVICFQQAVIDRAAGNILLTTLLLVANERTFLGYLRTSLALSMMAVIIAQLFRLQHTKTPDKTLGFYILGTPLACFCLAAAVFVLLLGSYRFWRQQNAILRGKVHAGGWELNAVGITVFTVVLIIFILLVAVDSRKDSEHET